MPSHIVTFSPSKRLPPRRGTNAVEPGDTLYAIQNGDLYFIWCYTDKEYAQKVADRVSPQSSVDIAANWRRNISELIHSDRSHD